MHDEVNLILTDIGGVCVENPYRILSEILYRSFGKDSDLSYETMKSLARKLDAGTMTFDDFALGVIHSTGVPLDVVSFTKLHDESLLEKKDVIELYLRVRRMYDLRLEAVSNMPEHTWQMLSRKFGFQEIFDRTFLSFRTGILKPDPGIFRLVLSEENSSAQNCIFIDDSAENVKAASARS
ncbi:MAG: HAD-IA family hydrolase, partial [Candidatus Thermoplasmatota archaeon]|nr:HAD-IA family hydrolase [Candidatus Thermoplasmatota archaeon]